MLGGHPTIILGFFQLFKNKSCIFKEKDNPYVTWKKNIVELEVFFTSQQIDDNCVIINL
jgi:hypothetical protein